LFYGWGRTRTPAKRNKYQTAATGINTAMVAAGRGRPPIGRE
jgi:hypothetical protein